MLIKTGYSFKLAFGKLSHVADRIKEIGWTHAPITDRCSTFGFNRWSKECAQRKLKPVFGVELAVVEHLGEKKPTINWCTFVATKSLKSLNEVVFLATSQSNKIPQVTFEQANSAKFRNLIKIYHNPPKSEMVKGKSNVYFSLSPSMPIGLYGELKKRKALFVASSDNRFVTDNDEIKYLAAMGRRADRQLHDQHILSDAEWREAVSHFTTKRDAAMAIKHRNDLFKKCTAKLTKGKLIKPEKKKTLQAMCLAGAKRLKLKLNKEYKDRLNYELKLIKDKGFDDYFYIIADIVSWSRKRMFVGPARGSSAGSLVCYLLGITTVDPIKYDLIFERFLDINRSDMPDIDIDFSDTKRHLVFEHMEKIYGADHVARLGTVGMMMPRSALRNAGSSLGVPTFRINKLIETIIPRLAGDDRAHQALEDKFIEPIGEEFLADYPEMEVAMWLEGHPSNASQHAAGVIVTDKPVTDYISVDARTSAAMCDKKDAEELDLLKIDALGLKQLSVFERTLELIGRDISWLESVPLDDDISFAILNEKKFSGVFQFTGRALQQITKKVFISHFEDLVAITSLARPGPSQTGGTDQWILNKTRNRPPTYMHDSFAPILDRTLGVIAYQEQVMQICRDIGKMSWPDVIDVRRAMGKSLGADYLKQYEEKFKQGAMENGLTDEQAGSTWEIMRRYGAYAFNRSHAVSYAMISYWCCYLKARWPMEYGAAMLDIESDPDRMITLLRELAIEGVKYKSFDLESSGLRWEVSGQTLIGPLTNIDGVGVSAAKEIMAARESGKPVRAALQKKIDLAKTPVDTLTPISDRIAELHPCLESAGIKSRPWPIAELEDKEVDGAVCLGVLQRAMPRNENDPDRVRKRGYSMDEPTDYMLMVLRDDTDEMLCRIDRYKFGSMGKEILDRGGVEKALYAFKGRVTDFKLMLIDRAKYLGEMS